MSSLPTFRLLATLSIRLALRGYLASKAALLGAILLLLVLLPISIRLTTASLALYNTPQADTVLRWTLLGLFCLFALAPLSTAAALPHAGDPSRLLMYPVTPRVLVLALAVGTLAEVTTPIALPPVFGIVAHFGVRSLPALLLLLTTALLFGQALLFIGGALARSRRIRELLTVALPFAMALLLVFAARQPARAALPAVRGAKAIVLPDPKLGLTPPGLASQAIAAQSLPAALGLLVWAGGTLALAGKLVSLRAGADPETASTRAGLSPFPRFGRGVVGVIAAKELTYFLREPTFRVAVSRSSATLILVGVLTFYPTNAPSFAAVWDSTLGMAGVFFTLLWVLERTANLWGSESAAGALLWSFPGPRWRWVVGKNLALLPLLGAMELFFLGEYALIVQAPLHTLVSYFGMGALWIGNLVAIGNLVSARFPFPVLGEAASQSAGQSFGTGILYLSVAAIAAYLVVLPLAPLWTAALWGGSIPLAGQLLLKREPQLIEALES